MGFFDPIPEPPKPEYPYLRPRPVWAGPSHTALPGVVGDPVEVARTEDVALIVAPIFAYPNGLRFELKAFPKSPPEDPSAFFEAFTPGFHGHPPERLRFGVQYPDGAKATTVHPSRVADPRGAELPKEPVLHPNGAHGGAALRAAFWLWPLPVDGLEFVVEWQYQGIPETRASLDGAAVREAAASARDVWD